VPKLVALLEREALARRPAAPIDKVAVPTVAEQGAAEPATEAMADPVEAEAEVVAHVEKRWSSPLFFSQESMLERERMAADVEAAEAAVVRAVAAAEQARKAVEQTAEQKCKPLFNGHDAMRERADPALAVDAAEAAVKAVSEAEAVVAAAEVAVADAKNVVVATVKQKLSSSGGPRVEHGVGVDGPKKEAGRIDELRSAASAPPPPPLPCLDREQLRRLRDKYGSATQACGQQGWMALLRCFKPCFGHA